MSVLEPCSVLLLQLLMTRVRGSMTNSFMQLYIFVLVSIVSVMTQFQQALERVRAGADVMPQGQLQKVIAAELGSEWRNKMATFEDEPLAAASIGQVSPVTRANVLCDPKQ